jgi:hypothetical protein
MIKQRPSGIA